MVHWFDSRILPLRFLVAVVLITAAAFTSSSAAPTQFFQPPVGKATIDPADFHEPLLAAAIFQETNRQRADLSLLPFSPDERASNAARLHARWMAGNHVLSHDEPAGQGPPTTASDRLMQQGLRPHATAENTAYNLLRDIAPGRPFYTRMESGQPVYSYRPGGAPLREHTYDDLARVLVAQWMHSPRHRAHIADPRLEFLGVGVALAHRRGRPDTIYGVQDFFTPHTVEPSSNFRSGRATALPPRP